MNKPQKLFVVILFFVIFTCNGVVAKDNITNIYNIEINDKNYKVLKSYMNDEQIKNLSPKAYNEILSGNVETYQSALIASTYYYDENSGNFKKFTSGVGLSQNLVDSASEIENELITFGTCTNGGTVYVSYQHAQADIDLTISKYYTLNYNGMGYVFNFYGDAVGIYDNTPGMILPYTC